MHLLGIIIIGFIVGLIARLFMPKGDVAGFILTTLLGIGGSLVGQYVGVALGMYQPGQPTGFVMSVIGAMLILFVFHIFRKSQTPKTH